MTLSYPGTELIFNDIIAFETVSLLINLKLLKLCAEFKVTELFLIFRYIMLINI